MNYVVTCELPEFAFLIIGFFLSLTGFSVMLLFQYSNARTWKEFFQILQMSFKDFFEPVYEIFAKIIDFLKRHKKEFASVFLFLLGCIWKLFLEFRAYLNGEDTQKYIINNSLGLTEEDVIELTKRLDGRPYDTPIFCSCSSAPGIVRYEYRSCGLTEKYSSLDAEKLFKVLLHQIRNYIIETRRMQPYVVIEAATPTCLCFAIALSEFGKETLSKQESTLSRQRQISPVLEEEAIDIWKDSE